MQNVSQFLETLRKAGVHQGGVGMLTGKNNFRAFGLPGLFVLKMMGEHRFRLYSKGPIIRTHKIIDDDGVSVINAFPKSLQDHFGLYTSDMACRDGARIFMGEDEWPEDVPSLVKAAILDEDGGWSFRKVADYVEEHHAQF